jgi:hypothetical protein
MRGNDLLRWTRGLLGKAISLMNRAETSGDLRTALQGIREARSCLELLAKVTGELSNSSISITLMPEWVSLRTTILEVLEGYPDARSLLLERLEAMEG